jgi:hypothetical protein
LLDRSGVAEVHGQQQNAHAGLPDLLGRALQACLVHVEQCDVEAVGGQAARL